MLIAERTNAESPGVISDTVEKSTMHLAQGVDRQGPQFSCVAILGN